MPCYYPEQDAFDETESLKEALKKVSIQHKKIEAMLCATLQFIEVTEQTEHFKKYYPLCDSGLDFKELIEWWKLHKKKDKARRLKENKTKKG